MSHSITCYLGLGANLPRGSQTPEMTIKAAIKALEGTSFKVTNCSGFYVTKPVPLTDQPDFINCVVVGETDVPPKDLLDICHKVEARFGRERHDRWSARTLDIDILAVADTVLPSPGEWQDIVSSSADGSVPPLTLPHPRLHERAFVLQPLAEIAPDWLHPQLGQTSKELLQALSMSDRRSVRPFSADLA